MLLLIILLLLLPLLLLLLQPPFPQVTAPLNQTDKTVPNMTHIQSFVANLLKTAFPHLSDNQIKITVTGLFNLNQDIPGFKVWTVIV